MHRKNQISTNNGVHLSVNIYFLACCSLKEVERIMSYKTTCSTVSKQDQCKNIALLVSILYLLSSLVWGVVVCVWSHGGLMGSVLVSGLGGPGLSLGYNNNKRLY